MRVDLENMEPSVYNVDVVYEGICALFLDPQSTDKAKADKWLGEFQRSIYSWTISDELLRQKRDLHSCYFAAQTMRAKIQNSFSELPQDSHESLRDSLISHISQVTDQTDQIIVTQLSLAVADLVLLMCTWHNPISDLLNSLGRQETLTRPLLEILILIPEEIDSRYLRLGANRRDEIRTQLEGNSSRVMDFLCSCLHRSRIEEQEGIENLSLRCFAAWLAVHVIDIQNYHENPIAQHILHVLNTEKTSRKLHETAAEALCTMLACVETGISRMAYDQGALLQLFISVCGLEGAYLASVTREDSEKTMDFCRIFTVLGETYFTEMLRDDQPPHYSLKALDLVLMCIGHYDYEVAEVSFNLWYRLSEELFQKNNEKLTALFKPHVERLLAAMYRHVQIDADHEGLIVESDNFGDFRRKVSDLIKDVAFIVGSGACFKQMFILLQQPAATWESTEGALFIMQNVAKNIIPDENEVIPKVVEAILNLPQNTHIAVRYTSIMLLGELCDWIENHSESLEAVLNFLLYALQQKNGLAQAGAIALTNICASCRQKMIFHMQGLIEIARCLDTFEINNELAIGLLKGIAQILSRLPRDQLEPAMHKTISFQFQPIAQLMDADDAALAVNPNAVTVITKGDRTDPAYWMDRACAIIRHTNPDIDESELHPTVAILTGAWPLLSRVMEKYQKEVRVMERTCRLLRYGFRMVRKQAAMLVKPLVEQMIFLYARHRHSCFLYLGSVLVDEFARVDKCIDGLLEMLREFIEPTFQMLRVENGLKNNPDTVDDFFRLCSRFIDQSPQQFLESPLVTPIFQCALLACTLDHREANSSVMKFFCNLLRWGRPTNYRMPAWRPLVRQIAEAHGEALVYQLIHSSVFCLHSYMLPDVAEVLFELSGIVPEKTMRAYLKNALDALPKKNSGGYTTVTETELDDFANTVIQTNNIKAISLALKTFTRLFR